MSCISSLMLDQVDIQIEVPWWNLRISEITAQTYHRIFKLARTVIDLEGSSSITSVHLSEVL